LALLDIDHIPILSDPSAHAALVFEELGFRCSPEVEYRSQTYPDARWFSNCIFFENNWIDLLRNNPALGRDGIVLGGCLYRCADVDRTLAQLPSEVTVDRYDLIREIKGIDSSAPGEFDIAQLNVRHQGISLSLAGREPSTTGAPPGWLDHPNGARGILGVDVLSDDESAVHESVESTFDLSMIKGWAPIDFIKRFGLLELRTVVRFRVNSLAATWKFLAAHKIASATIDGGVVSRHPKLRFAIAFSEETLPKSTLVKAELHAA